ncbi:MAG: hypothetical protein KA163_04085 [Bacteroidia bacterium]|nr:hypothetical protein [Bacteroidia bacterium]
MPNKPKIVKEIVDEGYLTASLYSNGTIEIIWEPSLQIIDIVHLSKMQEAVCDLGDGKKMPLLFIPHDFLTVSKEGAKYAASEEGVKYTLAIAVLIDNLAKKILMNFFLSINKPIVPTKGFSNKKDACAWLNKFRKGTI